MKTLIPLMLLAILAAPPARAAGEEDKAQSGERFLEQGGKGAVGGGSGAVAADGDGTDRSALDLINAPEGSKGLKTKAPPTPGGSKLDKAIAGGKGAVYGGAAGFVVGGVIGSVVGPAGTVAGALGGAQLGAVVGVGIGFIAGFMMGGKEKGGLTKAIESHNSQLDELKGL